MNPLQSIAMPTALLSTHVHAPESRETRTTPINNKHTTPVPLTIPSPHTTTVYHTLHTALHRTAQIRPYMRYYAHKTVLYTLYVLAICVRYRHINAIYGIYQFVKNVINRFTCRRMVTKMSHIINGGIGGLRELYYHFELKTLISPCVFNIGVIRTGKSGYRDQQFVCASNKLSEIPLIYQSVIRGEKEIKWFMCIFAMCIRLLESVLRPMCIRLRGLRRARVYSALRVVFNYLKINQFIPVVGPGKVELDSGGLFKPAVISSSGLPGRLKMIAMGQAA